MANQPGFAAARARLARAHHRSNLTPDDSGALAELAASRRAYTELKLERAINDALATWPPLTLAQRHRLASLVGGGDGA